MPLKNGSRNRLNHPNQRRSNFKPLGFRQYFAFYSLIRKDINLGPPDLDSPQKCASGDICHFHFGSHPICTKNTPSIYGSYPVVITWIVHINYKPIWWSGLCCGMSNDHMSRWLWVRILLVYILSGRTRFQF